MSGTRGAEYSPAACLATGSRDQQILDTGSAGSRGPAKAPVILPPRLNLGLGGENQLFVINGLSPYKSKNAQKDSHGQAHSGGDAGFPSFRTSDALTPNPGHSRCSAVVLGSGAWSPAQTPDPGVEDHSCAVLRGTADPRNWFAPTRNGGVFWLKRTPPDLRPGRCTPQGPSAQSNREGDPHPALCGTGRDMGPLAPNRRSLGQTGGLIPTSDGRFVVSNSFSVW